MAQHPGHPRAIPPLEDSLRRIRKQRGCRRVDSTELAEVRQYSSRTCQFPALPRPRGRLFLPPFVVAAARLPVARRAPVAIIRYRRTAKAARISQALCNSASIEYVSLAGPLLSRRGVHDPAARDHRRHRASGSPATSVAGLARAQPSANSSKTSASVSLAATRCPTSSAG